MEADGRQTEKNSSGSCDLVKCKNKRGREWGRWSGVCVGGAYPHPPIADGGPVVRQPQHEQVHFVLAPATDAEAEALHALLQLHCEEVEVLRQLGQTQPPHENPIKLCAEELGESKENTMVVVSRGETIKNLSIPKLWLTTNGATSTFVCAEISSC